MVLGSGFLVRILRGGKSEFCALERSVHVVLSVQDQQASRGDRGEHFQAIELVQNAWGDLVPERTADLGIDLRFAEILRGGLVSAPEGSGAPLPRVVLQIPLKALRGECDYHHADTLVRAGGEARLDAAH